MKPLTGIAALIVSTVLLLSGCSENPAIQARYQAEKMFFEAERASRRARIRPDLITPEVSELIHEHYGTTLDFCYRSLGALSVTQYPTEHDELSAIAFKSATRLSQLAYAEEHFDSSVAVLDHLMKGVTLHDDANVSSHLNLGRALQAAGRWDSALAIYTHSITTFYPPVDSRGEIVVNLFNLPNHIYDVYVRVGDNAAAGAQIDRAEVYYRRLASDYPGGNLAGASHLSLAALYERLGRFDDAVAELSLLTDTTGNIATPAGLRIASLHASQLDRPDLAIEEYDAILDRLSGQDTLRRPMIMFNKGLVHLYRAEYGLARQTLIDVKRSYRAFFTGTPIVQFAIARTFELQDNWSRAETEYKYLINNFPGSDQSLSTYLYLIDKYTEQGRPAEATRLEQRAETEYDELAATRPGSRAQAAALSYKAELYRRRKDWNGAVNLLSEVFDKFSTSEIGFRAAITIALIYRDELNDMPAADSVILELKKRLTTVDESKEF